MSLYYMVSYRDDRQGLVDYARINGELKQDALRRVVQALANKTGKRLEVRRVNDATPQRADAPRTSAPRRNPSRRAVKTKSKKPAKRAKGARRSKPSKAAKQQFKKWHGFASTNTIRVKATRTIPATLVKLGELPEIIYRSNKWTGKNETYAHKTGTPRPLLCCDPKGKQFYIVGGRMRATARGIVG